MILITSFEKQTEVLLFIKKFKKVLGFKPIVQNEGGLYTLYVKNISEKKMYDAAVKAGRLKS